MRRISGAWTRDYTRAGSRLVCQWARSGAPDRMPREATPRRSANVGRWAVVSLGGLCALLPLPGATAFSAGLRLGASLSLRAGHAGPSTRAFSLPLGASAGVVRPGGEATCAPAHRVQCQRPPAPRVGLVCCAWGYLSLLEAPASLLSRQQTSTR